MKYLRYLFTAIVVLGAIVLLVASFASNEETVAAALAQMNPPTPAPKATPGPPVRTTPVPIPTLAQPLTEEGALRRVLAIESSVSVWRGKPWSVDTPRLEPGRVTARWYAHRSYDGSSYGPDAETGPVWVVAIQGAVRVSLVTDMRINSDLVVHDWVEYTVAQKTGNLLRVRTGPAAKDQPFLPKTVAPTFQAASPGTPAAISASSCTQNPAGLSFGVVQQPGKSMIPGAAGPVYSFSVEGKGFVPGEKVTIVIKGRVAAAGTMGGTTETVLSDSTFATSIGAAVTQPNMVFDVFVIHRRGVACVTVTAKQ